MHRTHWCSSLIENPIVPVGRRVSLGCPTAPTCCLLTLTDPLGCRAGSRDAECPPPSQTRGQWVQPQ